MKYMTICINATADNGTGTLYYIILYYIGVFHEQFWRLEIISLWPADLILKALVRNVVDKSYKSFHAKTPLAENLSITKYT